MRLPDWNKRLHAAIDAHRGHAFKWGEHDCALFAADCVRAMTGDDYAAGYRGRYSSAAGAKKLLEADGYASQVEFAAARFEEIAPAFAQVGDLAAVKSGERWGLALGVVTGPVVMVLAKNGVGSVLLSAALRAFRIG